MPLELHMLRLAKTTIHWVDRQAERTLCGRACPTRRGDKEGGLDAVKFDSIVCRRCKTVKESRDRAAVPTLFETKEEP